MRRRAAGRTVALVVGVLAVCLGIACSRSSEPREARVLTVFGAASLADAFREIGAAFERAHPGTTVRFNFGGSNHLRAQLEQGAPGDVFASADRRQMDAAIASGVVDGSTASVFARNRLALIVPRENPAGIAAIADLARPGVKVIVADPGVPVGNTTRLMLDVAAASPDLGPAFVAAFAANTISREQSVGAVVTKIALGEADAGIAYASDAAGAHGDRVAVVPMPPSLELRSDSLIAVTTRAMDPRGARVFVDLVTSASGAEVLAARGFMTPGTGGP